MSRRIVVTLRAPGFVWRVSDEPVELTDVLDGTPAFAEARLIDVDDLYTELDAFSLDRAEFDKTNLTIKVPPGFASASVDAAFAHLAFAVVEVATISDGVPWNRRRTWIGYGRVSGLTLDVVDSVIRLTAEASSPAASTPVTDASRDMSTAFQALGFPRLNGKTWPTVVGAVCAIPAHKIGSIASGGGTGGDFRALAICGHYIADTGQGFVVYADGVPYTAAGAMSLRNTTDDDGKFCCVVASTDLTDFSDEDGSFTVSLPGGGVAGAYGPGEAALRADGVVAYLLSASGVAVDWARMAPALQVLRSYEIGLYFDGFCDWLDALRERVLPLLPVVEQTGINGMWLQVVSPHDAPTIAHFEEGQNLIGFTGALQQESDPDNIRNRFSAVYGYDHFRGAYLSRVEVSGDTHPLCGVSRTLCAAAELGSGERTDDEIDVDCSWSGSTVARMLQDRADRLSMPIYSVGAYLTEDLDHLVEGDRVTVTSASLGWTERPCVLSRRSESVTPLEVSLQPIPIPVTSVWGG